MDKETKSIDRLKLLKILGQLMYEICAREKDSFQCPGDKKITFRQFHHPQEGKSEIVDITIEW